MSNALNIAYASNSNHAIVSTIEFIHPDIASVRLVYGHHNFTAKDEDGRELQFLASQINMSQPAKNAKGKQDLNFQLDDVTQEIYQYLELLSQSDKQAHLILRDYLKNFTDGPAQRPIKMLIKSARYNPPKATIVATFGDLLNLPWPRKRYTNDFTPGLQYV